jgi:hypothetical protein
MLYKEKNRKQKAINNLHNLRQKNDEPFANFFPKFERKISNAEADQWPNDSKISYLRNSINEKLKMQLINASPINLLTYINMVTKCE